jgi:hypothetical protein
MASFNKNEVVVFERVLEKFQDYLIVSKMFNRFEQDDVTMERAGDIFWRPMPYIIQSYSGNDASSNFNRNHTQLSVPISLGTQRHVPMVLTARELRDPQQRDRLSVAAAQRLASDVNVACSDLAALQGSIFIKRTAAAVGFDDVAAIDTAMNRMGVPQGTRKACYSSADFNNMASNLAGRGTVDDIVKEAYQSAYVSRIAGIDVFKLDYAYRLAAAVPGASVVINGANQRYVPSAITTSGGVSGNTDNRFQNLAVTVGAGGALKVGDAFTIAGVNEVHHITKADTGSLKTFRIVSIVSGGGTAGANVLQITPPIIAADASPTDPELQYRNCTATPANGAALTFQNTAAGLVNPFWEENAFTIMPGRLRPEQDAGLAVMSATLDNGLPITMTRQGSINDLSTRYRFDVLFGIACDNPQMAGVEMFSQP